MISIGFTCLFSYFVAIDDKGRLTDPLGLKMAEFPVDPIVARMLLKSGEFQVNATDDRRPISRNALTRSLFGAVFAGNCHYRGHDAGSERVLLSNARTGGSERYTNYIIELSYCFPRSFCKRELSLT